MKRKGIISCLVLAAIAVVLVGLGVWGLLSMIADRNNQPSDYEVYREILEDNTVRAQAYLDTVAPALENINGYRAQLQSNRDLLAGADAETLAAALGEEAPPAEGAEPAAPKDPLAEREKLLKDLDKLLADADAAIAKVEPAQKKMQDNFDKITGVSDLAESDTEAVTKAQKQIPLRVNQIRTQLKIITKIDKDESASNLSVESTLKKLTENSAAAIAGAFPGLDLGAQFTVYREVGGNVDNVTAPRSFPDIVRDIWDILFWLGGLSALFSVLMLIKAVNPDRYRAIMQGSKKNMMLVALVFITLIFFVMTRYTLLSPTNVSNIINQNAYIIILACGMLLCIVCSANIDLSVGRVMGFIGACAAKFMIEGKMPVYLAVPLCLGIGILIGMWQGFWIAYMKIPAFVVTLAGQLIFYGLTMMILQGLTINNFPATFNAMFNAYLPDFLGGLIRSLLGIDFGINVTTMFIGILVVIGFIVLQVVGRARRVKKGYPVDSVAAMVVKIVIISAVLLWLFYSLSAAFGLPTVLFTVAVVLLVYLFITSRTVIGRHLYAMGGNVNAARLSGVKTQKMLFLAYVNMGLLAALAGLVYAARLNAASPQAGAGDELYAIASCYIGGASAYGGIGTVGGALIGAMTMGVIKNGMSIMSLGQDIQQIVLGVVLLAAVVIDIISKNGSSISLFSRFHREKKHEDKTTLQTSKA